MILNTGSRTDIPAYYSDWFYERVRAGEVLVRNPYYPTLGMAHHLRCLVDDNLRKSRIFQAHPLFIDDQHGDGLGVGCKLCLLLVSLFLRLFAEKI